MKRILVLLEGGKNWDFPKIELVRKGNSERLAGKVGGHLLAGGNGYRRLSGRESGIGNVLDGF